jgi:phosphoglycolate phosphatase
LKTILVDLDGTMVDPAPGIIRGFQLALTALARPEPAADELRSVIGPPSRVSFARLLGGKEQVETALAHYRAFYSDQGIFQASPYDGIHDALAALKQDGARLLVCTSKAEVFARRVVAHFGLLDFFDQVYGAELDGRFDDKGDLMQHILGREGFAAGQACMIGDRLHDIAAARRHGMKSVGVLWGFGSRDELTEAGASALCDHPSRLRDVASSLLAP